MSDSAGERLMTCMYCYNLLPQKDFIYHINYECRFIKQENKLPDYESSLGYNLPQIASDPSSVLRKGHYPFISTSFPIYSSKKTIMRPGSNFSTKKRTESSTTQADVPETVIDKENSKYQELSSLDAKDVDLLTESLKELLTKSSDHDVKIIVQDKQFNAHRIILRTRSPVFAMMLTHDSEESITGTIRIEDCDPDSFDEFLLYLYSGRTENFTPSKALHIYYTADKYDLPALKERCVIVLKTSLSVESICDVILLATRHDEKELLEAATKFFAQNMREILPTVHWQQFLSKNPIEGNELYIKSMDFLIPRK